MYIVVGSATAAERLKRAAERIVGFPAYVVHTPAAIHHGGCSYSVRLDDRALNEIKKISADNGISFKKMGACLSCCILIMPRQR